MAFLDNINKFKRIQSNYTFADTLIDGAFNIIAAPVPTLKWIVVQTIVNILLEATVPSNTSILSSDKNITTPTVIDRTTPAKLVLQAVVKSATQEGKDYIKKFQKIPPIKIKSAWLDQIWFVPSPLDENLGSIAITFIGSATKNKPPVLTPPWFRKETFDNFKNTSASKGGFYLNNIAIGTAGKYLSHLAFSTLSTKFYSEVKYYQEIWHLNDTKARTKIIANSNKWEEMFPETKGLEDKMRLGGVGGKIDSKINQIKTTYTKTQQEALKKAQAIQQHLNSRRVQLSQWQTAIKLIARGVRNPQELLEQTILTKVRNTIPYASAINNIIDIYKRKGANIKNLTRTRAKKSFQKKINRWQKQSIVDNINNLDYQRAKARLEENPQKVRDIDEQIKHLSNKYDKINIGRHKRTRFGISSQTHFRKKTKRRR